MSSNPELGPEISQRLMLIDVETTGLLPDVDIPLEIGFMLVDINLDVIDYQDWLIWNTPVWDSVFNEHKSNGGIIWDMHNTSQLWEDAQSMGLPEDDVQEGIVLWLESHNINRTDPLVGSSVFFDRRWMEVWFPKANEKFSYRNIDCSSIKELCRRFNPEVYSHIEKYSLKRNLHRVQPDLEDTLSELRFYLQNFLATTVGDF